MFLKVGVAMLAVSLVIAVSVAAAVNLRTETASSVELRADAEKATQVGESDQIARQREFNPGQKLEIDDDSGKSEPAEEEPEEAVGSNKVDQPEKKPAPKTSRKPADRQKPASTSDPIPDWPEPTGDELASTEEPRYYQPASDADMSLTIEA